MALPYLSIVRLVSDQLREEGVEPGAIGVIVDVYNDDAYEVEFSDPDGITLALTTLRRGDLEFVCEATSLDAAQSRT